MIIRQDGQEIDKIDFGIVEVGLSREISLEVENDGTGVLENLSFTVEGAEVVSSPESIAPKTTAEVVVKWTPSLDLREPMRSKLEVEGREVWR